MDVCIATRPQVGASLRRTVHFDCRRMHGGQGVGKGLVECVQRMNSPLPAIVYAAAAAVDDDDDTASAVLRGVLLLVGRCVLARTVVCSAWMRCCSACRQCGGDTPTRSHCRTEARTRRADMGQQAGGGRRRRRIMSSGAKGQTAAYTSCCCFCCCCCCAARGVCALPWHGMAGSAFLASFVHRLLESGWPGCSCSAACLPSLQR